MSGRQWVLAAAVTAVAGGTVIAATEQDDLAVVKRAVARQEVTVAPPSASVDAPRLRPGQKPEWLKVRIQEKGAKKARVTVNVPIALVRALGDDFPIDIGRHRRWRDGDEPRDREKVMRMGEVLALLDSGQSLVEIDDEESTVRIWVE